MRRLGITGKLVFSAVCIFAGLGLVLTWHSVRQLRSLFYAQTVQRVEAQVLNWLEANTVSITVTGDPRTLNRLVRELKERKGIAYVILLDADGRMLAESSMPAGIAESGPASTSPETVGKVRPMKDAKGRGYFELVTPILASGTGMSGDLGTMFSLAARRPVLGMIRVGIEQQEIGRSLTGLVRQNIWSYAAFVLLALTVNVTLARRMVKPITAMARVANQIARGRLSERVQAGVQLQDEVGELVRNFNRMGARLAENQQEMSQLNASLEDKVRERTLELEQANRRLQELDELKSKFLSTVSHELRSPLTSIKAFAQILVDSPTDEATRKRFLDIIDKQSDRLSRLISDLLDLAKIESKAMVWKLKAADLRQVVAEATDPLIMLGERRKIRLEVVAPEAQPVCVDTDRMQQVVTNLVDNAIKFSDPDGRIKLVLSRTTISGPHKAEEGQYALVSVSDHGSGIPRCEQEHVFEKFYRGSGSYSAGPGTGLGLAISREIVWHHRGEIWLESEPGFGTTFYFTVPLRDEKSGDRSFAGGHEAEGRQ
jgi:signal transduction histidine kinase